MYQTEKFDAISEEVRPLLVRHWREVAKDQDRIKLAVDDERYRQLDEVGMLLLITARDEVGVLVGYIAAILSTHLHYAHSVFAMIDVFWLEPEQRRGLNGVLLFRALEDELRKLGVMKVFGQTKVGPRLDISRVYKWLGWMEHEILFSKVL